MTAWIALVIATASLTWNIISTVYSWLQSRAKVQLVIQLRDEFVTDDIGHVVWLRITALNIGGAPAAVTAVGVGLNDRREWRHENSPTQSTGPFGIIGPALPSTIETNHVATWDVDLAFVVGKSIREPRSTIAPYVSFGNGRRVARKYTIGDWKRKRALEIFERRHEHHKEGAAEPSDATKRNCPYCQLQIHAHWHPRPIAAMPPEMIESSAPKLIEKWKARYKR